MREGVGYRMSAGPFASVICIIPDKQMMKATTISHCDAALIISSRQNGNMSFDARLFLYACSVLDICVSFKISHHNMESTVKKRRERKEKGGKKRQGCECECKNALSSNTKADENWQ